MSGNTVRHYITETRTDMSDLDYNDIPEFLGEIAHEPENNVILDNCTADESIAIHNYLSSYNYSSVEEWALDSDYHHVLTYSSDYWVDDFGYVVSIEHALLAAIECATD